LDGRGRVSSFLRAAGGEFFPDANGLVATLNHGMLERYEKNEFVPSPPIHFRNLTLSLPNRVSPDWGEWIKPLKHYDLFELLTVLRKSTGARLDLKFFPERHRAFIAANYILQQHIASAVAIFLLSAIAIPLGIHMKRKESSAGTLIALALVLGYYFLTIVVSWGQTNPDLRVDLMAWVPAAIIAAVAIPIFKKIIDGR
jgi:lipopolysaccharide export LptBFGC system permease protein LptF